MFKSILMAYDGSEPAERAFDYACFMAKQLGARVEVLWVIPAPAFADQVERSAALRDGSDRAEQSLRRLKVSGECRGNPRRIPPAGRAARQPDHPPCSGTAGRLRDGPALHLAPRALVQSLDRPHGHAALGTSGPHGSLSSRPAESLSRGPALTTLPGRIEEMASSLNCRNG